MEKDDTEPGSTDRFTGAEADIRTTQGGKKVATVRVCTTRYTNEGGERKNHPTLHTIEIWIQATVNWLASKALPKGAKVFVQGEIRNEQFTGDDRQTHSFTKVVVASPSHELRSLDRPEQNPADEA